MKRIKQTIERVARLVANWLNSKTEKLSIAKKKIGLGFFCVLSGVVSVYIILVPMIGSSFHHAPIQFQRAMLPKHIGKANPKPENSISKDLYERIEAFKNNDSLMKAHPELLDSIRLFEQLYQSQIKK